MMRVASPFPKVAGRASVHSPYCGNVSPPAFATLQRGGQPSPLAEGERRTASQEPRDRGYDSCGGSGGGATAHFDQPAICRSVELETKRCRGDCTQLFRTPFSLWLPAD